MAARRRRRDVNRQGRIEALPFLRAVVPNARIVEFAANPNYAAGALAAGADCFIEKGVTRQAIAEALLAD